MKKITLISAVIILSISLSLFIFLNIKININNNLNEKIVKEFGNFFSEKDLEIADNNELKIPVFELNSTDYIGIINIEKFDIIIPVESKCNNSFMNIQSACNNSSQSFTILGTTFKDSFKSVKLYNVNDDIAFTNALGQTYQYKIKKIKRVSNLNDFSLYMGDLIIGIKNYYDMEYILLICDFN